MIYKAQSYQFKSHININYFLSFPNIMKIFILFSVIFTCGFFENIVSNVDPLPYEAIFNFGDSTSDTGNAAIDHQSMDKNSPYILR